MNAAGGVDHHQAYSVIDLEAISHNVATLRAHARSSELMAVVKADAYSHGLVPAAHAALRGGASRLGVATIEEALALRSAEISAPVLAWLVGPVVPRERAIAENVEIAVHSIEQLGRIEQEASAGRSARIHLKVDTGMGRGGVSSAAWPDLCRRARISERLGRVQVEGIWSHLSCADDPESETTARQIGLFREACALAADVGLRPTVRHIANSASTLMTPESHLDMVRPGLAIYGVDPRPAPFHAHAPKLRPAMSLRARISHIKKVPAGSTVSYGAEYTTRRSTRLAVVPVGYADGIPFSAGSLVGVQVAGRRHPIAGRICMDQFVVDLGETEADIGDEVIIFGDGADGEPTAREWAAAAGTIPYEVLTRIGGRVVPIHTREGRPEFDRPKARRPEAATVSRPDT